MPNTDAVAMPFKSAVQACVRWKDLTMLQPEQASSVMEIVLGRRILAADAADTLRRVRRRQSIMASVQDTRADFKRSALGKQLGAGTGTTMLYKLITQKRLREDFAGASH